MPTNWTFGPSRSTFSAGRRTNTFSASSAWALPSARASTRIMRLPDCRAVNSTSSVFSSPAASSPILYEAGTLSPLPIGCSMTTTLSALPVPLFDSFSRYISFLP